MLLRKLGGNLYCLRLTIVEPYNGSAQSDMLSYATESRRNQVSPISGIISSFFRGFINHIILVVFLFISYIMLVYNNYLKEI